MCFILVVAFSINSQELFEVASTYFNARIGASFSGAHSLHYLASPEYFHMLLSYSGEILFFSQRGLINETLEYDL
jgi:hypothetical protein